MTARAKVETALAVLLIGALGFAAVTYVQEREARVKAEAIAQGLQQGIDARDKLRDQQIADLQTQLKQVKTPAQAVTALPRVITLPQPVKQLTVEDIEKLIAAHTQTAGSPKSISDAPIKPGDAVLPLADLQPIYERLNVCKQNEISLATCQQDAADFKKQRDAYKTALNGGTFFARLKRNSKWLAIGGGVALVALCSSGHCR